jgi:hypothetical protein
LHGPHYLGETVDVPDSDEGRRGQVGSEPFLDFGKDASGDD